MSVVAEPIPERSPDPAAEALRRFDDAVFKHASLERAFTQIRRRLADGMPPSIVVLVGSTGVGKTTLAERVVRKVREGAMGPSQPSACPVVSTTCPPAGRHGFLFDMGYWHALAQGAGSPTPGAHRHPDAEAARLHQGFVTGMRSTLGSTRRGTLEYMRARRVRLVVLDEAQHMADTRGGQSLARQLDVIKTSVDSTGITHLLVGTYDLRALVMPNGQLGRRSKVIDFQPYQPHVDGDLDAFAEILSQLVQALPLDQPERSLDVFEAHISELLFHCAGCVGVLKDWLRDALQVALEEKRRFIAWSLMQSTRPDEDTLLRIASDIHEYREARAQATRSEIERKLGFGPKPRKSSKGTQALKSSKSSSDSLSNSSPARRSKPGSRSAARDPVHVPPSDQDPARSA